jgi:predicted permease
MLDSLARVRHALRSLAKRPAFTVVALLTLTIGIAATSAIFTLVNAVLLRPLPYREPSRLVSVYDTFRGELNAVGNDNYEDWRRSNSVFEAIALRGVTSDIVGDGRGASERVTGADVTASFFDVLGVRPAIGRPFVESEEFRGDGVPVIILTHGLWQRLYGGREVVGRTIAFNGRPVTVVGIMPPQFWFAGNGASEYFVPMRYRGSGRGVHQYDALARLKPGVSRAFAQADMSRIAARIAGEHPQAKGWGVWLSPMAEDIARPLRAPLAILLAAAVLLLVIACANLASLLLVRTLTRMRDMAVRAALGAGRRHLVTELLVEAGLLALSGALAGVILGAAVVRLISAAVPRQMQLPMPVSLDAPVVAFSVAASLLTALAASLFPTWRLSRLDLSRHLHATGGGNSGASVPRLLQVIVVGELALSALLLVAGGLLVSSLSALQQANLGFRGEEVATLQVQRLGPRQGPDVTRGFYRDLLQAVQAMPRVESAAATWSLPLSGQYSGSGFDIEGRPSAAEWRLMSAQNQVVSADLFRTLGVRLLEGRTFDDHDREDSLPVVVVNQALAVKHWPGGTPVGARIGQAGHWLTVVGVVADVRHHGPARPAPPAIYRLMDQSPAEDMFIAVRGPVDRVALANGVREWIRRRDATVVVTRVEGLRDALWANLTLPRVLASAMSGFAAAALLLAIIGLYGAIAQWVGCRRHEVGVRLALGATRLQVVMLVVRRTMLLSLAGIGTGLALAVGVTGLMRSFLFGVTPTDIQTFANVVLVVAIAALLSSLAPARSAASVDPIVTLKSE